ncbi:stage 0 sporulation protein A [Clostridium tepidiprofundi DSM 19306]|uniref:Stage 0 sporulation protein A homolog n=1 Tax=Clostridium tepidiprofundi DSM 19306 TaxID=1121338 RepID=A0A151B215_9CLOT|nr:DNA-binding domain-containing protein [Clostridium tepidiprofundi]KYH33955.1 stage 0 sporulation protein A [Clostridium tepidiprofundi DSM 19306]
MKIFIVEDDINIIKILEKIIIDRKLGSLIGYSMNGIEAYNEISSYPPDIVLIDLLMPEKDGITLVSELKPKYPNIQFIMISQVSSKDIIGKAYNKGIEYYIQKPINALEVENIIKKVIEKLEMNITLNKIEKLFLNKEPHHLENNTANTEQKIKTILKKIGILGENGSEDIIKIVNFLIISKQNMSNFTIRELLSKFSNNPKSLEQKIRRAVSVGMSNIAHIGIEDYMNESFVEYSNSLYNFEQIKKEMDWIRGNSNKKGKINLKKFLDGMLFYCEK